jgi:hypothetical protein
MTPEEIAEMVATVAWELGEQAGRRRADVELQRAWESMARKVVKSPTRLDVAAWLAADAAGQPCPARCGRCSMCIRSAAVTRRGGDYTGGPVKWEDA